MATYVSLTDKQLPKNNYKYFAPWYNVNNFFYKILRG